MIHNTPYPLSDELAQGILGRFATSNGIPSINVARNTLRANFKTKKNEPTLWLLAKALDISPSNFMNNHSLIPILFPFSYYLGLDMKFKRAHNLAFAFGLPSIKDHIYGCEICITYDRNTAGVDYWHRIHQIAKISWCIKHNHPLFHVPSNHAIYPPSQAITSGKIEAVHGQLNAELHYPALHRFQTILTSLLSRQDKIHIRAWNNVVSLACRNQNIRISQVGNKPVVSDLIQRQFPSTWLSRHLPEVLTKIPYTFVHKVDGACKDKYFTYPALVCATILAVLFEDAQQALQELDNTNRQFLTHQNVASISTETYHALRAIA